MRLVVIFITLVLGQDYQVYRSQETGKELFKDLGVVTFGPPSGGIDQFQDIIFADFEEADTWPRGWTASADFPYTHPLTVGEANANPTPNGFKGQRFVTTLKGDNAQGTLTSPQFTIGKKFIHLLVGGGNHPDETYVGLFINNVRVYSATGDNGATFHPQTWDVTAYVGQTAEIRIVDQSGGGWGFIMCDQIVFSDGTYIAVNTSQKYQEIIGFGGAFTETSAYNWAQLSPAKQEEVIALLFDPVTGLDMSVCRTHINSPDFALEEYTYVTDNDPELKTFDLGQDRKWVMPFIKAALKVQGDNLLLFGSPWSPPAFMKSNGIMEGGGNLLKQYYQSWADYFVKYIQEYAKEGVNFWGVTVQNEPLAAQSWESCIYTGQEEGDWATNYLRPDLDKNGLNHITIQVWDHNRDVTKQRAIDSYSIAGAVDAVWGVANHWYGGDHWDALDYVHETWPKNHITTTEFCRGDSGGDNSNLPYSNWGDMDAYAHEIIGSLNHWTEAITDWNMIVDQNNGPYHNRQGGVKASIVVNRTSGEYTTDFIYHSIGHFSKFIKRGAVRVNTNIPSDVGAVEAVSAVNTDGSTTIVVLNRGNGPSNVVIGVDGSAGSLDIPAHSLITLYKKK